MSKLEFWSADGIVCDDCEDGQTTAAIVLRVDGCDPLRGIGVVHRPSTEAALPADPRLQAIGHALEDLARRALHRAEQDTTPTIPPQPADAAAGSTAAVVTRRSRTA